jgi:transcriptional regulator with GAF, ATPase, and Fis domain
MHEVFATVGQVANSRATVLLLGETGTGKEMIAKAIHYNSPRKERPFIRVNCGALTGTLLESELFGHVKGSFTGAIRDKIGRFEAADGGTIFLDEIGTLEPQLQVKLLRVLQEREFERVGDTQTVKVDVRVIAATNVDLQEEVAKETFREDLFYRLNVVRIPLPPLRERPTDIALLVNYFLEKNARELSRLPKSVAASAIKAMEKYHWPGNVRELENAVRRAHVMAKSDAILLGDLPPEIAGSSSNTPTLSATAGPAGEAAATDAASLARQLFLWARRDPKLKIIPAVERELVIQALIETHDNQVHAAKLLGITRATLRKRIEKFGIQRELNVK